MPQLNLRKLLLTAALLLAAANPEAANAARAVPGDYDGDGRTDIVVARSLQGGWHWFIRLATGQEVPAQLFGLAPSGGADTLYAADWDGDGDFGPGVVRAGSDGFMRWYAMQQDGSALERLWGLTGDRPIVGYYDNDSSADLAVVRNLSGFLYWFIKPTTGSERVNELWGLAGDTPFAGDLNGDGVDDLVVSRSIAGGLTWYSRSLDGNELAPIQWGLASDTPLAPYDVNGDGYDDLIIVRSEAGGLKAYVRQTGANGSELSTASITFGLSSDTPFFGSFNTSNVGDFGVYRTNGSGTSSHYIWGLSAVEQRADFGLAGDMLVRSDGAAVLVGNAGTPTNGSSGALSAVCSTITGISGGTLWKPSSDDSGPPRQGRPVMLFKSNKPSLSCLPIYASDGTQISALGLYSTSGQYGSRYYAGYGCGDRKSASQMAQAATAAAGSPRIYVRKNNSGLCAGPITPTSRTGSL